MDGLLASLPGLLERRFVPLGRLGAGGMGEVLKVHDRLLDRVVALKLVPPGRAADGARLAAEFAVLSRLDHPGIVRVHEVGRAPNGAAWMVSELVTGQRLDHWLADASPTTIVPTVADLLATLGFLHGHGLVHGDIKPANVLVVRLDNRPWPVLIDFGLATDASSDGELLGGTRAYLAPELLRGAAPGPRTDLYALGRALEPAVRRAPALEALVAGLTREGPAERPSDAGAALALLGGPSTRRLGARGHATLWPDAALDAVADAISGPPGHHDVQLPADADAELFALALKARLDLDGVPCWVLPPDDAFAAFGRALTCLLPTHVAPTVRGARPDDHKAALDALADAAVTALAETDADAAPVLVLPDPARVVEAVRYLIARLAEAGALPRVCAVHGPNGGAALGRGLDAALTAHVVPPPGAADVERFLDRHGIDGPFPPTALALLEARAAAGAAPLRALLAVWHRAGALTASGGGRWRLTADAEALAADAPDLDALWAALWEQLGPLSREAVLHLHELGGGAPIGTLEILCPGGLREIFADLLPAGWLSVTPGEVSLAPDVARRLATGALTYTAPTREVRRRYVALLIAASPDDARAAAALARQEEALGAPNEAAAAWRRAAELQARRYAPAAAGAALMNAARCAEEAEELADALADAALAARLLDAGGDLDALRAAAQMARAIADRLFVAEAKLTAGLVEARAAIRTADSRAALAALDRVEPAVANDEQAFDLALARGTALAQAGRRDEAARALADAADRAERRDDLHGLGRVANNLGIVDYQRGDVAAAARAWERSADAKAKTGDLRGQRIAESNRALALRELGRIAEAHAASLAAAALAERIGDRVGQAMGQLALAQLWLDVGAGERAAAALDAFDQVPATSAMMRGDAAILRARAHMAAGASAEAAALAARVALQAREDGLATVAAEAWTVAYAATARAGRPLSELAPEVAELLGDAPAAAAAALREAGDGPADAVLACLAHAEARSGAWDAARTHLAALADGLDVELPRPAATPALDLAARAARVLADRDVVTRLDAVAARVVADRVEAARRLLGDEAPEPIELATRLGLPLDENQARILLRPERTHDAATPQESTHLSATDALLLRTWDALPPRGVASPAAWVEALHAATRASRCELVSFADGDARVAARAGDAADPDRFLELARGLRGGGAPFVAGRDDGVEAIGLPLTLDDEAPIGSLFVAFDGGAGAAGLDDALLPAAAGAALALALQRAREASEAASGEVERLVAAREAEARAHRDEVTALRDALELSQSEAGLRYDYGNLVHKSPGFRRVLGMLDKVTDNDLPVLITGESGVGKELLARALHFNGPRHARRFVAENCGAIPPDLFESVFFGHVRGAFTGAHSARRGLLESADGGTLFLDEIGELPLEHQVKLLRALQEKRFRPVGAQKELTSDFRVVGATNRDLRKMVAEGTFREDLYYRLAVVTIEVPPLRARRDDVLPLVQHMLEEQGARTGTTLKLTGAAADALQAYDWPGNVRELENEVLRAAVLCEGTHLRAAHLSPRVLSAAPEAAGTSPSDAEGGRVTLREGETLGDVLGRVEARVIAATLAQTAGKKAPAARKLGLSRPGLDAKIERHGIDIERIKRESADASSGGRGDGRR